MTRPRRVYLIAINLLNRSDRRRRVLNFYQEIIGACDGLFKFTTHILEACDGVTQSLAELNARYGVTAYPNWAIKQNQTNRYPSSWIRPQLSGGIASSLSHLDAICLARSRNWLEKRYPDEPQPILLIAEDDISLLSSSPRHFLQQLSSLLSESDRTIPDWDMLLLGAS